MTSAVLLRIYRSILPRFHINNIVLLVVGACVWSNTPEQIAEWRERAARGEAVAQYNPGVAYRTGSGVPEDKKEAVKWYKKAAEQGLKEAQFGLGAAYSFGRGVPVDYKEALKWFRKSAEQGNMKAQVVDRKFNCSDLIRRGGSEVGIAVQRSRFWLSL